MNKFAPLLGLVLSASVSFAGLHETELASSMTGTVLLDREVYIVKGDIVLDARTMPGISALRVPVGAETVIRLEKNSKLTVYGGPGYGIIGGGAGIEVPPGAKLVVCGDGELIAYGGAAYKARHCRTMAANGAAISSDAIFPASFPMMSAGFEGKGNPPANH